MSIGQPLPEPSRDAGGPPQAALSVPDRPGGNATALTLLWVAPAESELQLPDGTDMVGHVRQQPEETQEPPWVLEIDGFLQVTLQLLDLLLECGKQLSPPRRIDPVHPPTLRPVDLRPLTPREGTRKRHKPADVLDMSRQGGALRRCAPGSQGGADSARGV